MAHLPTADEVLDVWKSYSHSVSAGTIQLGPANPVAYIPGLNSLLTISGPLFNESTRVQLGFTASFSPGDVGRRRRELRGVQPEADIVEGVTNVVEDCPPDEEHGTITADYLAVVTLSTFNLNTLTSAQGGHVYTDALSEGITCYM